MGGVNSDLTTAFGCHCLGLDGVEAVLFDGLVYSIAMALIASLTARALYPTVYTDYRWGLPPYSPQTL